jgi:hypothetical protein
MTEQEWNPESIENHAGGVCPFSIGLYKGRQCLYINSLSPGKMMFFCGIHYEKCAEYRLLLATSSQRHRGMGTFRNNSPESSARKAAA